MQWQLCLQWWEMFEETGNHIGHGSPGAQALTQLSEYNLSDRFKATLLETHRITPENSAEVRKLLLNVSRRGFHYKVSQNVGVLMPGTHAQGQTEHFRLYTIAGVEETAQVGETDLELCVSVDSTSMRSMVRNTRVWHPTTFVMHARATPSP